MSSAAQPITRFQIQRNNRAFARASGHGFGLDGRVLPVASRLKRKALSCLAASVGALVVIKVALFVLLGAEVYDRALVALAEGSSLDGIIGFVMQADVATRTMGALLGHLIS